MKQNNKGRIKRRRIRANQNNLSTEEKIVKAIQKERDCSMREAWRQFKFEREMRKLNKTLV